MRYRIKVVLLSLGVVFGFGSAAGHFAHRSARIGPDIVCRPTSRAPAPAPAPAPEKPRQP